MRLYFALGAISITLASRPLPAQVSCSTYSIVGIPAGTTLHGNNVLGPVTGSTTVKNSSSGTCGTGSSTQTQSITSALFGIPGYITESRGITYNNNTPNPFKLCNGQIVPQGSGQVDDPANPGTTYTSSSAGSILTETTTDSTTGAVSIYKSVYDVKSGIQSITVTETVHLSGTDPAGCTQTLDQSTSYSGTLNYMLDIQVAAPTPCTAFLLSPFPAGPYSTDRKPKPTTMNAAFVPAYYGLPADPSAAAAVCGFDDFNWQQTVDVAQDPSYSILNSTTPLVPPFLDPPPGGYPYESDPSSPGYSKVCPGPDNSFPLYLDTCNLTNGEETTTQLTFDDTPLVSPGNDKEFTTSLVGVIRTSGPTQDESGYSVAATLFTWKWKTTFTGKIGGVTIGKNLLPADPGSGSGGITITNINGVQLPAPVQEDQISITSSGLAYSRVSQTFNGTVTIKNIGGSAISGPLQIVFFGMPANVTLVNATGNLSGTPYLTVPSVTSPAFGQWVTISVQFKNPSNATINLTPVVYSGSF